MWFTSSTFRDLVICASFCYGLCSGLSGNEGSPKPLQPSKFGEVAQTLRYAFHHTLEDPRHKPATFQAVSAPVRDTETISRTGNETSDARTIIHPGKIKVRKGVVYRSSAKHQLDLIGDLVAMTIPVVTDKDTIVNLATMSSDVYYFNSSTPGWRNLTQGFNDSLNFGYDHEGLRGHVFSNVDNSTIIVAFKGSSIDPRDRTRNNDRLNDNLLFSCCCATQRPDPFWYGSVCGCREDIYRCNSTCLTTELTRQERYYAAATSIMHNVTKDMFPDAAVWTTGHSLGGSLASLMGLEFGLPAITFEAPPERLPARRLGLVSKYQDRRPPTYHFGNTGDPVYMGACQGLYSSCALAGFAFESQCFTGKRCIYDTMADKGWRLSIANHRINTIIEEVLKAYDTVPDCVDEEDECADCAMWNFD